MKINQLANSDVFNSLVEDIKGLYVEGYKSYEELKLQTMHSIGKRILEENDFLNHYGKKVFATMAESSGISERVLYRCKKFAEKVKDFDNYLLTQPSNWTWTKEVKLLDGAKPCQHKETETKEVQVCKDCGKILK
ncbi:MAG: hypothetical protein WDA47_04200 [Bacilli bacterium]|jgi:hypothetical protein